VKQGPGRPRKGVFPANATKSDPPDEDLKELPKPLLEHEIPRFLKQAQNTDDLIAVSLMIFSGLRVGEVEELKVSDLELEKGELTVRAEVAKRSKERRVPIDLRTVCEISARVRELKLETDDYLYPRKKGLESRTVSRTLQRRISAMGEASQVRGNVHPHRLRHTAITQMLERGMPIEVVKEIAGHEDLETTMIYTHISTKHRVKTFQEAFGI